MNKRKGMAINAERSVESSTYRHQVPNEEWVARVGELQDILAICPADILAGSELAKLLEQMGLLEEALCHWNAVLACDPNSLNAREGVDRCRMSQQLLQPRLERNHAHDLGPS
jgi:tetratricopeptide (TPR) repeat protein